MYKVIKTNRDSQKKEELQFNDIELLLQWCKYVGPHAIKRFDMVITTEDKAEQEKTIKTFKERVNDKCYILTKENNIRLIGRRTGERFDKELKKVTHYASNMTLPRIRARLDNQEVEYTQEGICLMIKNNTNIIATYQDGNTYITKKEPLEKNDMLILIKFFKIIGGFSNVNLSKKKND